MMEVDAYDPFGASSSDVFGSQLNDVDVWEGTAAATAAGGERHNDSFGGDKEWTEWDAASADEEDQPQQQQQQQQQQSRTTSRRRREPHASSSSSEQSKPRHRSSSRRRQDATSSRSKRSQSAPGGENPRRRSDRHHPHHDSNSNNNDHDSEDSDTHDHEKPSSSTSRRSQSTGSVRRSHHRTPRTRSDNSHTHTHTRHRRPAASTPSTSSKSRKESVSSETTASTDPSNSFSEHATGIAEPDATSPDVQKPKFDAFASPDTQAKTPPRIQPSPFTSKQRASTPRSVMVASLLSPNRHHHLRKPASAQQRRRSTCATPASPLVRRRDGTVGKQRPSTAHENARKSHTRRTAVRESLFKSLGNDDEADQMFPIDSSRPLSLRSFMHQSSDCHDDAASRSVTSAPSALSRPPRTARSATRRLDESNHTASNGSGRRRTSTNRLPTTAPLSTRETPTQSRQKLSVRDLADQLGEDGYIEVVDGKMRLVFEVDN